jgi:hypothetical protein
MKYLMVLNPSLTSRCKNDDGSGSTRQQQHLLGAYSFAAIGTIDLTIWGLSQSGTWNYLREEITVALECRRPVRISTAFEFDPKMAMTNDIWANAISYLLARVINLRFQESRGESLEIRASIWLSLASDVAAWKEHRPATFNPFSTAPKAGNPFPSIWLVKPWHGNVSGVLSFAVADDVFQLLESSTSR